MTGRTSIMTAEERKEQNRAYMREYRKSYFMPKESRKKHNAYQRQYRKENPEKVKRHIENYIINKAARLLAEREAGKEIKNEQS